MGKCCPSAGCKCVFRAGPGITLDGTGSPGTPVVISADGAEPTELEVTDSDTVDLTLTGSGRPGSAYNVSATVILDPAPPGGGDNLLQTGPGGLFLECEQVRGCLSAGDGAGYDPDTGIITARPSTDDGNSLSYGTDGGLLVPPAEAAPLTVGCGLQGDGTAAAPVAAFPVAGSQPWDEDWECDPAVHSTLKCDPGSGALWTPPEHTSAAASLQQNHPLGTPVFAPTDGFVIIDETAWSEGAYTADSLTACRGLSFSTQFTGHTEVEWASGSVFDLAYAVSIGGAGPVVRLMHSILTPAGPAGRERWTFKTEQAIVLPPHTGYSVRVYPAIRVVSGSVTVHQWITDTHLIAMTR
ncbi:hypothetical protein [Streptomyces sp. AD55]|uniref:hypothetical protein n=1 Tax=Streptomyces sp. AD55 TaxID=3242895 RepID=UPI003528EA06